MPKRIRQPSPVLVVWLVALFAAVGAQATPPPPALAFTPSTDGTYDFGAVQPGQSGSQEFTLTNSGGTASAALTIALSGSPAFTTAEDACSATSLGPGKSCGVTVEFSP